MVNLLLTLVSILLILDLSFTFDSSSLSVWRIRSPFERIRRGGRAFTGKFLKLESLKMVSGSDRNIGAMKNWLKLASARQVEVLSRSGHISLIRWTSDIESCI